MTSSGWWCRGRVLSYSDWGSGFDSQHRLNFFHNISFFILIFCFSFGDAHLRHRSFLSDLFNLLGQRLSFFPSSSILFLSVQVFLYFCSVFAWHCWNQESIRNCCFVVQWKRQINLDAFLQRVDVRSQPSHALTSSEVAIAFLTSLCLTHRNFRLFCSSLI